MASFGGPTREYQVRVDPNKLISYGLSIAQVEQQLTNNNVNAGGSFIEAGLQQINVREVGLVDRRAATSKTPLSRRKNGTALRVKDIAVVAAGPEDPAGPVRASASIARTARSSTTTTWFRGIVLLRKGADADPALRRHSRQSEGAERRISCRPA